MRIRVCCFLLAAGGFGAVAIAQQGVPVPSLADDEKKPRVMAGLERRTVNVDGRWRVFYVHNPAELKTPAPAQFALDVGNGTAPRRVQQRGFNALADLWGQASNDFDSSEEAWAFVKRFSLP